MPTRKATDGEIRLPRPHAGQIRVRREARRINWLVAGRRWRKTTLFMTLAVDAALGGKTVFWGAPVYDQVRIGWDEARKAAGAVADFNQTRMTALFPGGGKIIYRSLDDPDNARGHTADALFVDEAPENKAWAWSEVLRPLLLDTGGGAWLGGTPKGLNWYYDEWSRASAGGASDAAAWQAPTLGCKIEGGVLVRAPHPLENPNIQFTEMAALWDSMTEAQFRQEILAEFVDAGDAVFNTADIAAMAQGWMGFGGPRPGRRYLTAWDIGRRRDATFGITIDWTALPYQIVASERVLGVPYPHIQMMIEARARLYEGETVVEANNAGDPVIENLNTKVTPFVTTSRTKVDAITALQLLLERGALKGDIAQLTHELRGYRWDDRTLVQDGVMALAIAAAHLPIPGRDRPAYSADYLDDDEDGTLLGSPEGWRF